MQTDLHLREAVASDMNEILHLLNVVFSDQQRTGLQRDIALWQWKYIDNPFGKSIMTVAEANGKIVGFDHLWRWEFKCRGEILKAVQPCDSVVDSEYSGRGYFRKMRESGLKKAIKGGAHFSFNFPNKNSLPLNRSIGSREYGTILWRVKILKPMSVLKDAFINSQFKPLKIDRSIAVDPDVLDSLAGTFESFDRFIKIHRVEGFHKWRYMNKPHRQYGMITTDSGSKMAAAVFTINKKSGLREMVVVDLVGNVDQTQLLLEKVVSIAKDYKCGFIALMDNERFDTSSLWKNGFIKKRLKNMVVLPFENRLAYTLESISAWSLMAGIHDSI